MSKERTLKDSDVNRQLLASSRRVKKLYQFFAVIIAAAFISSAITLTISADGPTGFGTVIEPGSMVQDASYVIFEDGGVYYATHGMTGEVAYSGATASTVLQSAIDSASAINGKVVVLDDITLSTVDIAIKSNVVLEGHDATIISEGFRFNIASRTNVVVRGFNFDLTNLGARNGFTVTGTSSEITLSDMSFFGHSANADVLLVYADNVTIRDIRFYGNAMLADCIMLGDGCSGVLVTGLIATGPTPQTHGKLVGMLDVELVVVRDCITHGMALIDADYDGPMKKISVLNNYVNGWTGYGIIFMGGTGGTPDPASEIVISGNHMTSPASTYNAIAIYGLTRNVVVDSNVINMSLTGHNAIGISSGVNVVVSNNVIWGCHQTELSGAAEGGIEVESNPVHNRYTGISENVTITGNVVYDCYWGIYTRIMDPTNENWAGSPLPSKGIIISGNLVTNCTIGVNLVHGVDVIVANNQLVGNIDALLVDTSEVVNYTIHHNAGYLTEIAGASNVTGAVNTLTIDHSLALTPTIVIVSGNNTGIGYYFVTSITATQFVITFENQPSTSIWKFYWYAEV